MVANYAADERNSACYADNLTDGYCCCVGFHISLQVLLGELSMADNRYTVKVNLF